MKTIHKLFIGVAMILMSFLLVETHVFVGANDGKITFTYYANLPTEVVIYNEGELEEDKLVAMFDFKQTVNGYESVPFNSGDEEVQLHPNGVEIHHIPLPSLPHYSFAGWAYKIKVNGIEQEFILRRNNRFYADVEFYAKWTPTNKSIFYHLDGGTNHNGNPQRFNFSNGKIILKEPTKIGYKFLGWFKESSYITEITEVPQNSYNINLYAKWELETYNISYKYKNSEGVFVDIIPMPDGTVYQYNVHDEITLPVLTKEGHTFNGWSLTEYQSGEAITTISAGSTGDKVFYTSFQINNFTIKIFHADGSIEEIEATFGEEFEPDEIPSVLKVGHSFEGWFFDENYENEYEPTPVPEAGFSLYPKWVINQYTITFVTNEGTAIDPITEDYNTLVQQPVDPTKANYTFEGWYSDEDLETKVTFPVTLTDNLTLYAKWKIAEHQVIFLAHDDEELAKFSANHGQNITPPTGEYVILLGYDFIGWSINGVDIIDFAEYEVIDDVTFKTTYQPIIYNITYNIDGDVDGTHTNPLTYTIETEITLNGEGLTKVGHEFLGWWDAFEAGKQVITINEQTGDKALYARWETKEYTITFNTDGGNVIEDIKLNYGEPIPEVATPIKEGYTFTGWDKDITGTMPAEDLNIKALWDIKSFSVSFVTNSDQVIEPKNQNYESLIDEPVIDDKVGYQFSGWYIDAGFVNSWEFKINLMPAEDIILYALWEPKQNTYKVHHYEQGINDDTYSLRETEEFDKETGAKVTAIPKGYIGFTVNNSLSTLDEQEVLPDGSLVINIYYDRNTYAVTFNYGEGLTSVLSVRHGGSAAAPDPTRVGHTFIGWDATFSTVNEDLSITALYEINKYTITFNTSDGTTIPSITEDYGAEITQVINDPEKAGHTFIGWDKVIPATMPAEDLTITANWVINQYTITFVTNEGTAIDSITEDYDTSIEAPDAPTKDGYTFAGWHSDEELETEFEFPVTLTNNLTLYAKWEAANSNYTIKYYYQEVTGSGYALLEEKNLAATTDSTVTAPKEEEIPEGFIIDENQGLRTGTVAADGSLVLEIYYNRVIYTVNFDANGGNFSTTEYVMYQAKATKPATDPTKEGYTFAGWFLDGETETFDFTNTPITKAIILTAKYTINTYTVTFLDDNEAVLDAVDVPYGETSAYDGDEPTKEGHTFTGWYLGEEEFDFNTPIIEAITLTAKYTINKYTVTFLDHNGTMLDFKFVEHNSLAEKPDDPTREGYTFAGWFLDGETETFDFTNTPITKKITLTATYTINKYTVIFLDYNDEVLKEEEIEHGGNATPPSTSRSGYNHIGWTGSFVNITSGISLTATYKVVEYTITFESTYKNKTQLADAFLNDFYDFLGLTTDIRIFKHGSGNYGGFNGTWYNDTNQRDQIYKENIKNGNDNYFLSSSLYYAKWQPFADFMDNFIKVGNSTQDFWSNTFVGTLRLWQYLTNRKPGSQTTWTDTHLESLPGKMTWTKKYNIETPTFDLDTFVGFTGWYDAVTGGNKITNVPKGSIGNKAFYARWENPNRVVATKYLALDSTGKEIVFHNASPGIYWYTMAFERVDTETQYYYDNVNYYRLLGKGTGYTNPSATAYLGYHDDCTSSYKNILVSMYGEIKAGDVIKVNKSTSAPKNVDFYLW